jgi:hypothetical protein
MQLRMLERSILLYFICRILVLKHRSYFGLVLDSLVLVGLKQNAFWRSEARETNQCSFFRSTEACAKSLG